MSAGQLGPYVLFHQLAEDALSETYRAGLKSGEDVERVVLLCLFHAGAEDVDWIAETAVVGTRALAGLESPYLADIIDSGEIEGRAFLAYDYIPGIALSRVLQESRREGTPVPLELALLIVDRAAKGLSAAWEHESRMLHGFLAPPLMMVSNEGEVRLLGFEVASRLRRLLANEQVRSQLGAYLPPEIVPDGQPATTDDVYSLGAMLFDLSTGKTPPTEESGLEAAVQGATLVDGSPLPDEIRELLGSSLAPPQKRLTLKTWSEKLSEIVLSGRYEATSFNLAFFLHRLFGAELEDERAAETARQAAPQPAAEEVVTEVAEPSPPPTLAVEKEETDDFEKPVPQPGPVPDFAVELEVEEAEELPPVPIVDQGAHEPPARQRYFAIAASIIVLLLVILGASFFSTDDAASPPGTGSESSELQPLTQPTSSSAAVADPSTESASAADAAVEPATASPRPPAESSDPQSAGQSPKRNEASVPPSTTRAQPTGSGLDAPAAQPKTPSPVAEPLVGTESPTAARPANDEPQEAEVSASESTDLSTPIQEPAAPAGTPPTTAESAGPEVTPAFQEQPDKAATSDRQTVPAVGRVDRPQLERQVEHTATDDDDGQPMQAEPVQRGDLVSAGVGIVSPKLLSSVEPNYPLMARRLKKRALVEFRLLIDENGETIEVEPVGGPAGYGFDEAALKAVNKMTWEPATKDGVPVKMWTKIRLDFQP